MRAAVAFSIFGLMICACVETPGAPARSDSQPTPQAAPAPAAKPAFVPAAPGDVAAAVARASVEGTRTVVYVGASWCEPCQAFHHALEAGELDDVLAGVRFVEFDSDADGERLEGAGYGGRYIPRFAIPRADGTPSGEAIEGGIKGGGAVEHIMERLGPMLARTAPGQVQG
jgi:thiol-disulfide isomerase/thioredoxin